MKNININKPQKTYFKMRINLRMILGFLFMILLLSFFALPFISSVSLGVFEQNTSIDLIQTCDNCTYCNLTKVTYPNSTIIVSNVEMSEDGTAYNYTLAYNYTNELGTYKYCYECGNANEKAVGCIDFEVTPTGVKPTDAQGSLSIGIIVSILFIMFFFGFLSFKLMDYEKLYPVALFFLLVSIIIAVYGLYLGLIYSRDYLYITTSAPQSALFTGILYGLTGVMFISLLMLIVKAVGEIKERKSIQRHGEGYNPKTKQYEY